MYEQHQDRAARDYGVALSTAKCALERGDSKGFAKKVSAPRKPFNSIYSTLRNNYGDCLRDNGTTDRRLYVAAFAEALASTSTDTLEDRAMPVDVDIADAFIEVDSKKVGALDQVARFAVVYSPGLAYKLFQTEAGSDEEKISLDALYVGTPECRNSKSPESITTALQRAAIAYAFFSWTNLNA